MSWEQPNNGYSGGVLFHQPPYMSQQLYNAGPSYSNQYSNAQYTASHSQPSPSSSYAGAQYRPSALRSGPYVEPIQTAFHTPSSASNSTPVSPNAPTFGEAYKTAQPASPRALNAALDHLTRIAGSSTPPVTMHSTSPEAYSLAARSAIAQPPALAPNGCSIQPGFSASSSMLTSAPNAQHLGLGIVRQQPPGALADLPRAMQDTVLDTPLTSPSQDSVAYFEPFGRVSPPPSSHGLLASSSVPAMPPASGPHVHNKIQAAYGLMESALAEMKPQQAYGSQPTQKIAALEKAMSQFKDNFLDQGASESLPASASHSPTLSKGDKKRMLPQEGEVSAPPPKRAESAHSASRKSSFIASNTRLSMPPLSHTHSSPIVPSQSHFQPSSVLVPSAYAPTTMSATPIADATVAGVHLPLNNSSAPQTTSSNGIPQLPPLVMPLPNRLSHMPSSEMLDQQQHIHGHLPSMLQSPSLIQQYAASAQMTSNPIMSASNGGAEEAVRSQPTSPHGMQPLNNSGLASNGYFDTMNSLAPAVYDQSIQRQPPNPRMFVQTMINSPSVSPTEATSGPKPYQTHAPAKSWAYTSLDPSSALMEQVSAGGSGTTSRPRSNTVGSSMSRSVYDNPSPRDFGPADFAEQSLPAANVSPDTLSPEIREQMDYVFGEWLQALCNDLEATDSKGEPIHQTLMAKKMQKLDDSGEYRPFRFRIQAFTNRFAEELVHRGMREADVPHKLIRIYLWNQPLISRYNEEGKKAKSKGNHVWSIDAKKLGEGRWHFRPFQRRIVNPAARIVREGNHWSWEARIWDPQISSIRANYSSPSLPPWLSWRKSAITDTISELSGTAPFLSDLQKQSSLTTDETLTITVYATFEAHGQVQQLEHTFDLTITATPIASASASAASSNAGFRIGSGSSSGLNVPPMAVSAQPIPVHMQQPISQPPEVIPQLQPLGFQHQLDVQQMEMSQHIAQQQQSSMVEPIVTLPPQMDSSGPSMVTPSQMSIESIISPANLLAAEQRQYGETGPLVTALIQQEEAFNALNTLPDNTHPEVVSSFQQHAERASIAVSDAVSEAQTTALHSLLLPAYPDQQPTVHVPPPPPSSASPLVLMGQPPTQQPPV